MSQYAVGDMVWFHAPRNVNQYDHGLDPFQVVEATVVATDIQGPDWYTVEYDGGREISAADYELSPRTGRRRRKVCDCGAENHPSVIEPYLVHSESCPFYDD